MKKVVVILSIVFFYCIVPAEVSRAETHTTRAFRELKELSVIVEDFVPELGLTKEEIRNIVSSTMRAKLPALKIKNNLQSYLYVRIVTLSVSERQITGHITVSLKRELYLPDMKNRISGGVKEYENLFYVGKESAKKHITDTLNDLMNLFVQDYTEAKKYYSGELKKESSEKSGNTSGQKQIKGIWTNQ